MTSLSVVNRDLSGLANRRSAVFYQFIWQERLLAVFRRVDMHPPVRGEAPLTANLWTKGRFQSKINDCRLFCSKPGDLLRVSNIAQQITEESRLSQLSDQVKDLIRHLWKWQFLRSDIGTLVGHAGAFDASLITSATVVPKRPRHRSELASLFVCDIQS